MESEHLLLKFLFLTWLEAQLSNLAQEWSSDRPLVDPAVSSICISATQRRVSIFSSGSICKPLLTNHSNLHSTSLLCTTRSLTSFRTNQTICTAVHCKMLDFQQTPIFKFDTVGSGVTVMEATAGSEIFVDSVEDVADESILAVHMIRRKSYSKLPSLEVSNMTWRGGTKLAVIREGSAYFWS